MTKLINTNFPFGALRGSGQLPALFNERWLTDALSAFDKWDRAFEQQNVHYPYDVSCTVDGDDNPVSYNLDIALAGITREDIKLNVKENQLIIDINKTTNKTETPKVVSLKNGISYRSCKLQFTLGKNADAKNITSVFKDGLLKINIPVIQPESTNITISVD